MAMAEDVAILCTFCAKPKEEVKTMVAGPGVYICDACVALCVELIEHKPEKPPGVTSWEEQMSDDDLLGLLPNIAAVSAQIDRRLAVYVARARARGITWTRIGAALGMTRQSAWERFSGEE